MVRDAVGAEGLILQKLEHDRKQRFRDAVDLVNKQDAIAAACRAHAVIDGSDDLAHRIFRHLERFALKRFTFQIRQADRALPRMMGHRIGDQPGAALFCNLFHNGGLSDPGRPDQQDRTLFGRRDRAGRLSAAACVCL